MGRGYAATMFVGLCSLLLLALLAAPDAADSESTAQAEAEGESPSLTVTDDRLSVDLVAEQPRVVTPTGLAVDEAGRVFVLESHTHKRPSDYAGPKRDRVLILEQTDSDPQADRITTYYEGFTHAMDITFSPDGVPFVSTRDAVFRLPDENGDDKADQAQRVLHLKTKAEYPHNGLSGLAFDPLGGWLYVGLGQNKSQPWTLIGRDGKRINGSPLRLGGVVFRCRAVGSKPMRFAQGMWNPWGLEVDAFGRLFATDNDPHQAPPCRLLHVVPGGHYGYEEGYGKAGTHPFQTRDGAIPGMLPMAAATSEAPGGIAAYEATALPETYRGRMVVAAWSDRRIETFDLKDHGATVRSRAETLVTASGEFRPVDVAVGPADSVYVSDWASTSYPVHGKGRIWRIHSKQTAAATQATDPAAPAKAIHSPDRRLRERAARQLAKQPPGKREPLRRAAIEGETARVRATAIRALAGADEPTVDFVKVAKQLSEPKVRALAVKAAIQQGADPGRFAGSNVSPEVRAVALRAMRWPEHRDTLLAGAGSGDPYLRTAAVHAMSRTPKQLAKVDPEQLDRPRHQLGVLLAMKRSGWGGADDRLRAYLQLDDAEVRFIAVKWVSDRRLKRYKGELQSMLDHGRLSASLYEALLLTLDRLEGKGTDATPSAKRLAATIFNEDARPTLRRFALQLIPPGSKHLPFERLRGLVNHSNNALRLAALRTLQNHPAEGRFDLFSRVAGDAGRPEIERAAAILGLAPKPNPHRKQLIEIARNGPPTLRAEASRALVGASLDQSQKQLLRQLAKAKPDTAEAINRILGQGVADKPARDNLDAWAALAEGPGDPAAGRRVFFNETIGTCSTCHVVNGRGRAVGPDLTRIGRATDRRGLIRSIVQPYANVAPHYEIWQLTTHEGTTKVGTVLRKASTQVYRDRTGDTFRVKTENLKASRPLGVSFMPPGLLRNLTDREIRDLIAFLRHTREAVDIQAPAPSHEGGSQSR